MTSLPPRPLPFAQQRLVFLALLLGMTMYMITAAIVLQTNDGKGMLAEPIDGLDLAVIGVAVACGLGAFVSRQALRAAAANKQGAMQSRMRFVATLVPVALLEGGCLFGVTVWMLHGNSVPNLVAALVLLALAVAMVPLRDPDADRADG